MAACTFALLAVTTTGAQAIDLSGEYVSVVQPFDTPCRLTFTQVGTALTIHGPCTFGTTTYTFDLAGSVDTSTGAFNTSGVLLGLCEDPNEVTMIGSGDGEVFSAATTCATAMGSAVGTKCNNGTLDASEDCEDGNTTAGDCCSATCRFDGIGSACTSDANPCTSDTCDGAGACQHVSDPGQEGAPCGDDGYPCTDDICNDSGQCVHPPASGSCNDANPCTTLDTCNAGSCVGGPIAEECVGTIDISGEWIISLSFFDTSVVRRFTQTGAILESDNVSSAAAPIPGWVNAATGAFQANTQTSALFSPCLEIIAGTVSDDAQEFTGTIARYCGIAGYFPPSPVTGQRCDPVIGCACASSTPCAVANGGTRVAIATDGDGVRVHWRWNNAAQNANFGDPTANSDYRLCVETPSGSFVADAPHGSEWRRTRNGFRYNNPDGAIQRLWLKSKTRVAFVPTQVSFAVSLSRDVKPSMPMVTPMRLRLLRLSTAPTCFEATVDAPFLNTSRKFLARE